MCLFLLACTQTGQLSPIRCELVKDRTTPPDTMPAAAWCPCTSSWAEPIPWPRTRWGPRCWASIRPRSGTWPFARVRPGPGRSGPDRGRQPAPVRGAQADVHLRAARRHAAGRHACRARGPCPAATRPDDPSVQRSPFRRGSLEAQLDQIYSIRLYPLDVTRTTA